MGKLDRSKQVRVSTGACQIYHCHLGSLQFILREDDPLILIDFWSNCSVMPPHQSTFQGDSGLVSGLAYSLPVCETGIGCFGGLRTLEVLEPTGLPVPYKP